MNLTNSGPVWFAISQAVPIRLSSGDCSTLPRDMKNDRSRPSLYRRSRLAVSILPGMSGARAFASAHGARIQTTRSLRDWLLVTVTILYGSSPYASAHSKNGLIFRHARLAVSLRGGPLFKAFTAAVVALIGTAQLDRYLTNGRHTDAAMDMLRQIRHAFGF